MAHEDIVGASSAAQKMYRQTGLFRPCGEKSIKHATVKKIARKMKRLRF